MNRPVPVRSVKKALDLLDMLAFEDMDRAGVSLSALAARMNMPVNTAHNLLKTMAVCGYVAQTPEGVYIAGPRCAEMGRLNALLAPATLEALREVMQVLGNALDESLTFAVLTNGRRTPLLRTEAGHVIRVDSAALESGGIFALPTGRVLAAFCDVAELERIISISGLPGTDWSGIFSRALLNEALAEIRRRGYEAIAQDRNHLSSFAVPVLSGDGRLVGALGCYAPTFRCGPDKHAAILDGLQRAAMKIAKKGNNHV